MVSCVRYSYVLVMGKGEGSEKVAVAGNGPGFEPPVLYHEL